MDAVLLTWRWQNILSIWIMIIALSFVPVIIAQVARRVKSDTDA